MKNNPRLTYSVEEAAYLLGVHELTVRAAIERGEIKVVRVGRRVLVPRTVLDHLLEPTPAASAVPDQSANDGSAS